MSTPALRVENVSKMYRLGEVGTGSLSHDLNRVWARLRGRPDPYAQVGAVNDRAAEGTRDFVWALRDIDFEVGQGEIVGIIGRNGAGKSTLLKLLSRVTAPTEGSIFINGRIASLLEVGTGFHPDLTGRENIFLNGAILGMNKQEIRARFDEIVEFSGCAKYIDTPVKRYSSGMHVRLAFAVAAHLETDILIVDEVLAVGDAEFQAKCFGKMRDLSTIRHRTVLFVSHNLTAVESLCPRSLLVDRGSIIIDGTTNQVITTYLASNASETTIDLRDRTDRSGIGKLKFSKIELIDKNFNARSQFKSGESVQINIQITGPLDIKGLAISVALYNSKGDIVADLPSQVTGTKFDTKTAMNYRLFIERIPLNQGRYSISLYCSTYGDKQDHVLNAKYLDIIGGDYFGSGVLPQENSGSLLIDHSWIGH